MTEQAQIYIQETVSKLKYTYSVTIQWQVSKKNPNTKNKYNKKKYLYFELTFFF